MANTITKLNEEIYKTLFNSRNISALPLTLNNTSKAILTVDKKHKRSDRSKTDLFCGLNRMK